MAKAKTNGEMLAQVLASVNRIEASINEQGHVKNQQSQRLTFDFEKVSKHDVMMHFLTMYERGWIAGSKDALQSYLATHTNLGTKTSVDRLYNRCLHDYVGK
ncbi:MAG: hypothetical protein IJ604_14385 [Prevotella sp.]|nr:hypothetical protein [Prevotella sp.]